MLAFAIIHPSLALRKSSWLHSFVPNGIARLSINRSSVPIAMAFGDSRRKKAFDKRVEAADLARDRLHEEHKNNGDETRYSDPKTGKNTYIASFTKGLPHHPVTGLLNDDAAFPKFVKGVDTGDFDDIKAIPLGPQGVSAELRYTAGISQQSGPNDVADSRAWESMAAGNAFDLEGPDAQSITMPPAPALESDELITEMTEIYWMSLLRDVGFSEFDSNSRVTEAVNTINATNWIANQDKTKQNLSEEEKNRLRGPYTPQTVFRGATTGDTVGPYISQFLIAGNNGIGNIDMSSSGFIQYGAGRIDQRVRVATEKRDYMTTWKSWFDVQNGADLRNRETYDDNLPYRFITTPRDLATYVHFDALYQAYLNACIFLLVIEAPFDKGIPFTGDDDVDKQQGFALFGGPHILTLVTEVATRALKAVRFQKYNTHRRLRPEAVAGRVERHSRDPSDPTFAPIEHLYKGLDKHMLQHISIENGRQNDELEDFGIPRSRDLDPSDQSGTTSKNNLLPMAFPEGSPMHPSYGSGHATVAGACVTILKAFFDHEWDLPFAFEPSSDGSSLVDVNLPQKLTLEGELNKLCSNISIGRNWAGVHYYSDYAESILLGEKVAIGILEEQMGTYKEDFTMTVPKFDGSTVVIKKTDKSWW